MQGSAAAADPFELLFGRGQSGSPTPPLSNSPTPPDGDELRFRSGGEAALLAAFVDLVASRTTWLQRAATRECLLALGGETRSEDLRSRDLGSPSPRLNDFYTNPLFIAAAAWFGGRAALEAGGAPSDRRFSELPMSELLPALERRFVRRLRTALARFWTAANADGGRARPETLQTDDTLVLAFTLTMSGTVFMALMSRLSAARAMVRQNVAIFRRTRVPGEVGFDPGIASLDELLLHQHWLDSFWITAAVDCQLAAVVHTAPLWDPPNEFPTVPFPLPAAALAAVPAPSQRQSGGQVPTQFLALQAPFRCREYFHWLRQDAPDAVDVFARDRVLDYCLGDNAVYSTFNLGSMLLYAVMQVDLYVAWLADECGLGLVEVLVAEEALEARHRGDWAADYFVEDLLANLRMGEAIRRRRHLWEAVRLIEERLPADLRAAADRSDYAALSAMLSALPGRSGQQVLAFLIMLRLLAVSLVSPAPADGDAAQPYLPSDDGEAARDDPALSRWFASPSFSEACRRSATAASNMRMLSLHLASELRGNFILATFACTAAARAAHFHLLALLRLPTLLPSASPDLRAQAPALRAALVADVAACLDLLDAPDLPPHPHRAAASALRSFLAGAAAGLEPGMLRAESQNGGFCPHAGGAGRDGACYLCAAEGSGGGDGEDPVAGLPEFAMAGGKGRRVRFADGVEVGETYGKEEYARAGEAEEEVDTAGWREARTEAIRMLLEARDMGVPPAGKTGG
ncbi:hypothetical protein DFJ74DRAFT_681910 [Hyaloraphidium curvatum]|nr:hypothetical protein DFJ74DRAFT_681910 [Hyaloraphidium curvatum]